ncbi:MAG: sigma-70 family RNA polymerase sigma factor [Phycisphaerales bacterium]|nr:sigma-70 family RNA polymerase sigma factor [Phycisphaerales bacterium]
MGSPLHGSNGLAADDLADRLLRFSEAHRAFTGSLVPPRLRSVISADDVLQETWIEAFRSAGTFRETDATSFDRWIRTLISHRAASAIRLATRLKRGGGFRRVEWNDAKSVCSLLEFLAIEGCRSPSSDVALRDASEAVRVSMARLSEERRRAIELVVLGGKSNAEAGAIMGRSAESVRGLVYHGCIQLRQYLGSASRYLSGASPRRAADPPKEAK